MQTRTYVIGHVNPDTDSIASAMGYAWLLRERRQGAVASRAGLSHRLRRAFERLGPAYIKLGQIISSGRGLFPAELVEEFAACRDQVPPEPFATVRRVVEEDLGRSLESLFARFDERCLAAASIAQVHAATLRSGEDVVVKVGIGRVIQVHVGIVCCCFIGRGLVRRCIAGRFGRAGVLRVIRRLLRRRWQRQQARKQENVQIFY